MKKKRERRKTRKTPPPPLCPVHGVRMLVGHASRTRQYRYCRVAGCSETRQVNRVFRLKNATSLRYWGEVDGAGRVLLPPDVFYK
ncbi:MAG: hypothetical protein ACM3U2_20725 [Deltaproteobacteria bacterium]